MIDLEKTVGPMRLRAWGLVLNFIGNVLALLGLSMVLREGVGWPLLILGVAVTLLCLFILARPVRSEE